MNYGKFGIYWVYNVVGPSGPIRNLGKVFFVTDCFGDLVMVYATQLQISLG